MADQLARVLTDPMGSYPAYQKGKEGENREVVGARRRHRSGPIYRAPIYLSGVEISVLCMHWEIQSFYFHHKY
mgnify:CR=1 FL=1